MDKVNRIHYTIDVLSMHVSKMLEECSDRLTCPVYFVKLVLMEILAAADNQNFQLLQVLPGSQARNIYFSCIASHTRILPRTRESTCP